MSRTGMHREQDARRGQPTPAEKGWRSGFCGRTNPPDSHGRCRGNNGRRGDDNQPCVCSCHQTPAGEATAPSPDVEHQPGQAAPTASPAPRSPGRLRVFPDLEQGSDEWHAQRRGMVTASVVGELITAKTMQPASNDGSRGLTALLVAERITGYTEPTYISDDMLRGLDDEPRAAAKYSEHIAEVTLAGFMVRDYGGFQIGYSPDGLVGVNGLIEVKSRRQKKHLLTILADEVPAENMAQLQCGLLVSGREWIDYVSYCGGMPLWVKRVTPDPDWFTAILAAVKKFEETAAQMVAAYHAATDGLPATERIVEMEMIL